MVKYSTAVVFDALGQETRRKIITSLGHAPRLSITALSCVLNISVPATLRHTEVLEQSGLIARTKEGRTHYCTLNPEALERTLGHLLMHAPFWKESFSRLEKHITTNKKRS